MKRECTHGYRAVETAVSIGGGAGQSSHGTDVVVPTGDVLSGRGDRVAMVVGRAGTRTEPGYEWQQPQELAAKVENL